MFLQKVNIKENWLDWIEIPFTKSKGYRLIVYPVIDDIVSSKRIKECLLDIIPNIEDFYATPLPFFMNWGEVASMESMDDEKEFPTEYELYKKYAKFLYENDVDFQYGGPCKVLNWEIFLELIIPLASDFGGGETISIVHRIKEIFIYFHYSGEIGIWITSLPDFEK